VTAQDRAQHRGWAALADGRWTDARDLFARALVDGPQPGALEGLSWAAWWLDDADTVFEARGRAYGLYRAAGDRRGAARMATWLASDELDFHGAWPVASGWLRRAHRLLDPLPPAPEHGWLAFHEGYLAHAGGRSADACASAQAALGVGRRFGVPDLEMLGLALEGAARVSAAEIDAGLRCLDEATAVALEGEATIPISGAWACCFLVSTCTAIRDTDRAFSWCDRIAAFAERYGSRYMLAFCRSEYGLVELWRGRWAEAERLLDASSRDYARSRPAWVGGPLSQLAELRRRQGRPDEAERLLDRAGPTRAGQLCRGRLALGAGDARRAVELAERSLRRIPSDAAVPRVAAVELLVRGRIARGELDEATVACGELRGTARAIGTAALRASADLADGMLAAARGEHEAARALLEDAADGFERCGAPFETAEARRELAVTLAALGRREAAARESGASVDAFARLGAGVEAERSDRVRTSVRGPIDSPVTRREREVLRLVAGGLTNRQIAEQLVVSEHTVHRHVTNILRKLDLPSRTAAAAHAVRTGLVDEPS
jgi:DNA-binding NarL/FixJ family response regulator